LHEQRDVSQDTWYVAWKRRIASEQLDGQIREGATHGERMALSLVAAFAAPMAALLRHI
jgi:hypothetical protein